MKLRAAILVSLFCLWATPAFSQGCAMCYSTAKATSKDGQRAISNGVIVLLVPPLGIMTLGVWMAFRYGKQRDLDQNDSFEVTESREVLELELPETISWPGSIRGARNLPVS